MAYFQVGGIYLVISFTCFYACKYLINYPICLFYFLWGGSIQFLIALSYLYNRYIKNNIYIIIKICWINDDT